jgi:membrane protein DedA with SNARE-associated domain
MLEFIQVIELLTNTIISFISLTGYFGIFFLMILESALMPVPSEVVMPFAGYLALTKEFDIGLATLAGTLGNLVGALIAYFLGLYLGRNFIIKYGKYILLKKKYLFLTEKWFREYGDKTIFLSRLMPVVRTVISLPAGIGKMDLKKFCIYTFFGSILWNFALTYAGFWLGKNWEVLVEYSNKMNVILIAILALGLILYLRRR